MIIYFNFIDLDISSRRSTANLGDKKKKQREAQTYTRQMKTTTHIQTHTHIKHQHISVCFIIYYFPQATTRQNLMNEEE